eukprot:gnl/Spiro4/13153_TR6972_c0_g1_i1.p1 gnl/Spiro4/13153_TR6972_c0_g1~~gnl/Spiro4/13153_TR6972_c0_g1_i1.p1  ORF type:complete len:413 (+),score=146.15 gnl/Spiro4/13153_TR6972_c0_g1_i1:86-1240(+)
MASSQTFRQQLLPDEKMARAITRRRHLEEERRKRIFDPRVRQIGVDKAALDAQCEERRAMAAERANHEAQYDNALLYFDQQRVLLSKQQERERRDVAVDVDRFRATSQQFHARREFDLNDPQHLRKDLPARIGDDDPRCGVSSMQKFEGEDLTAGERTRLQRAQAKHWSQQQMTEKLERKREEDELERRHAQYVHDVHEYTCGVAEDQRLEKADHNRRVRDANLAQAAARAEAERQAKMESFRQDLNQIEYQMNSDLLTENPDLARSRLGAHRINPMQFKGLRPDQHQQILNDQHSQRNELQTRRERAKQEEAAYARNQAQISRGLELQAKEFERQKREHATQKANEILHQASEQKARNKHMNQVVYKNRVDDCYFDQFGTSTR